MPHWPTIRLRRQSAGCTSPDSPLATVETVRGVRRLASLCPRAETLGLASGQTLAQARAICPGLAVAEADPQADQVALAALARWCERFTPLAAADPPDGLWLDISGCTHFFGETDQGETVLADALAARLVAQGMPVRLAVAGTSGAAWALARAGCNRAVGPVILPTGEEAAALAPLPVAALRIEPHQAAGLGCLGLKTVGDLLRVPRVELTARFGPALLLGLDQALGTVEEAIVWPSRPVPWEERRVFVEPIATPDDLSRVLGGLAGRLCRALGAKRLGGHRFVARFFRVDGIVPAITVATALPVHDAVYLAKLMAEKLETVDPGFGIEVMSLTAETVAPLRLSQPDLLNQAPAGSGLLALVDRLANRLGPERILAVAPRESHVPERAVSLVAPLDTRRHDWIDDPAQPRPIRLLRRPEPIEVTALLPDDPPRQFRWRGALHRVRAVAGPERIAVEWWHHDAGLEQTDLLRDYFRVEDEAGGRFWVFRVGLERAPRWFLHGLFG